MLQAAINFALDRAVFNYVILTLYVLNAGRWAVAGSWGDALYWFAAFQITFAVTFGFHR